MGNPSNVPTKPADNILLYIRTYFKYDPETGELFGYSGKVLRNVNQQGYIQVDLRTQPNGKF